MWAITISISSTVVLQVREVFTRHVGDSPRGMSSVTVSAEVPEPLLEVITEISLRIGVRSLKAGSVSAN